MHARSVIEAAIHSALSTAWCVCVPCRLAACSLPPTGVGLDAAYEKEINSFSQQDGYITREELTKLTRTFAENLGQTVRRSVAWVWIGA